MGPDQLKPLVISFLITAALGPVLIPFLRKLKIRQSVRDDGPRTHLAKSGTPTMGGLLFLVGSSIGIFAAAQYAAALYVGLLGFLGYGLIGLMDDYIKVVRRQPLGLKARYKLGAQVLLGALLGLLVAGNLGRGTEIIFPGTAYEWKLGWWYLPFAVLVLSGTTNAVNLSDGLDGLAAGLMVIAMVGLAVVVGGSGNWEWAMFAIAIAGGCIGFLVYNYYPAKVFMGDTGSLALGGALGTMALATKTELLLPLLGGVFVIEALSVIIQVIAFQVWGKRVFRMSPLHHHFELLGWPERKVVHLFWCTAIVFAVVSIMVMRGTTPT
ncbi:MAG: phospho-N-acetylmuramoyl-pentapeptide-transferase [Clostridia bacterium]|nr:phospho-N-acetylmuramoyl-pentapeptide-transferase [Clostridia bacterium]